MRQELIKAQQIYQNNFLPIFNNNASNEYYDFSKRQKASFAYEYGLIFIKLALSYKADVEAQKKQCLNDAIVYFNKAREIDDQYLQPYKGLLEAYSELADYQQARQWAEQAIERFSDDSFLVYVYFNYIDILLKLAQNTEGTAKPELITLAEQQLKKVRLYLEFHPHLVDAAKTAEQKIQPTPPISVPAAVTQAEVNEFDANLTMSSQEPGTATLANHSVTKPSTNTLISDEPKAITELKKVTSGINVFTEPTSATRFDRHAVSADGDCGFTAFGITRSDAYQELCDNLNLVRTLLQPVIREALLTEAFINYLKDNELATSELLAAFSNYQQAVQQNNDVDATIEQLYHYADNVVILNAYLTYDILDKKIDEGWSHPCVLQALAHVQGIELTIWQLDTNQQIMPHGHYPHYSPGQVSGCKDLLFVDGNHFEHLERLAPNVSQQTLSKNEEAHEAQAGASDFVSIVSDARELPQLITRGEESQASLPSSMPMPAALNQAFSTANIQQLGYRRDEKTLLLFSCPQPQKEKHQELGRILNGFFSSSIKAHEAKKSHLEVKFKTSEQAKEAKRALKNTTIIMEKKLVS